MVVLMFFVLFFLLVTKTFMMLTQPWPVLLLIYV